MNDKTSFGHKSNSSLGDIEVKSRADLLDRSNGSINFSKDSKSQHFLPNYHIEKVPMLFIDINLGKEKGMQRVVLYDDDDPILIADKFAKEHNLSEQKQRKLETMIA